MCTSVARLIECITLIALFMLLIANTQAQWAAGPNMGVAAGFGQSLIVAEGEGQQGDVGPLEMAG